MKAMGRRAFLGSGVAMVGVAMLPIPKALALVAPEAPPMRWFAVGNGEMAYTYLAKSAEDARWEYACVQGATVHEECPTCGEYACHDHNEDLDVPLDWVEVDHVFGPEFDAGNKPKLVDWVRAGFNVNCEGCEDRYSEPTECRVHDGRALCECCFEVASTPDTKEQG